MEEPKVTLTKEEEATAIAYIVVMYEINAEQLEYVGAVLCPWKNDKAVFVTFRDTILNTSRSARLYWDN